MSDQAAPSLPAVAVEPESVIVKTIRYDEAGFWISPYLWRDTRAAFEHRNDRCTHPYGTICNCRPPEAGAWRWIGGPGWYAHEENRYIYERLAQLTDMDRWWPGEFTQVDFVIPVCPVDDAQEYILTAQCGDTVCAGRPPVRRWMLPSEADARNREAEGRTRGAVRWAVLADVFPPAPEGPEVPS